MTDDEFAPVLARAERRDTTISEALRELVGYGALLERSEEAGLQISDGIQAMIARREPFVPLFARDPHDPENGPLWLVTPEEVAAHEAAA